MAERFRQQTRAPDAPGTPEFSLARASDVSGERALGAAIVSAGEAIQQGIDTADLNRARLEMTEGLGEINKSLENDTSAEDMQDRYGAQLDELNGRVMERVRNPAVARGMELEFKRGRVAMEAGVIRRQHTLQNSQARATLMRTHRATVNGVARANSPEEQLTMYETATAAIDDAVAADHITAEQGEAMKQDLDRDLSTTLALEAIQNDPAAAAAELADPDSAFGLDEPDRLRLLDMAERKRDAITTQTNTKLERRLDTTRQLLVTGQTVQPEALAQLEEDVAGTEYEVELQGALAASRVAGKFAQVSPEKQAEHIAALRNSGIDPEDVTVEAAQLRTLEAIHEHSRRQLSTDPVGYAMTVGLEGAAPLDLGDAESVENRMALVRQLVEQYGAGVKVLSTAEAKHFKAQAVEGTPDDQLAFTVSVIDGFGKEGAEVIFREVDNLDPVVRQAALVAIETGDTETAGILLRGRNTMKEGDELRAAPEDAIALFEKSLAASMQYVDARGGERERIVEAVRAYYADQAPGRVSINQPDTQTALLEEAIFQVTGGVRMNGGRYGGVQVVNGVPVKLPVSLDRQSAASTVRRAGEANWKAASLSGNLPHIGSEPTMPDDPVLAWVGGSLYRVGKQTNRGRVEWYQDPDNDENGFFIVNLEILAVDLLRNPPPPRDDDEYLPPSVGGGTR